MFGGLGNLTNLLKSAKELQKQMADLQADLTNRRYDGDAGAGMVRATVDGRGSLIDIRIDPQATKDVELLEDLVKAAVGAAVGKAQEEIKRELTALTGGLELPGLSGLMGPG